MTRSEGSASGRRDRKPRRAAQQEATGRRMLMVEDDDRQSEGTIGLLRSRGWDVELARDGSEALAMLERHTFDVMVLDLRMPGKDMDGEKLLEVALDTGVAIPPTIVWSAILNDGVRRKCAFLGAAAILKKPFDPNYLPEISAAVAQGARPLEEVQFDAQLLDYMVKRREAALLERLRQASTAGHRTRGHAEPVLVVLRRWNSWYPSVFPVLGGAYVVIGAAPRQDGLPPAAVIDPGFQFMRVLHDWGMPWAGLASCVITHNHPDHMGGVFEYMTARHALGEKTRLFCNPASAAMLGDCSGFSTEVKELGDMASDLIRAYELVDGWGRLRVRAFDTAHEEIGRMNSAKGLVLSWDSGPTSNNLKECRELVIVGDTEYDRPQLKKKLTDVVCRHGVGVVALHLGSSQLKQGTGKHLYLTGLHKLLQDIDTGLGEIQYQGTMLAVISEWGLEHATSDQIALACGERVAGFNRFSPVLETTKYLSNGLERIRLVPGDVGLVVGMRSGRIYLDAGEAVAPESCVAELTDTGLTYCKG